MRLENVFVTFAIVFVVFAVVLSIIGSSKEITGEVPCVDGKNRVNLEGIMCAETKDVWFGIDSWWMFLVLIPPTVLMVGAFISRNRREEREK